MPSLASRASQKRYHTWTYIRGPTMAEIPSLIRLRLPIQVIGYTSTSPKYAAISCTTWATNPNAVATPSSVTSLCESIVRGGPGSAADNGIGNGTAKTVYNKSEVERSSIGNMDARTDNSVVRVGVNRLRKASRLLLPGGEYYLRARIQITYLSACRSMSASLASSRWSSSSWCASPRMFFRFASSSRLILICSLTGTN